MERIELYSAAEAGSMKKKYKYRKTGLLAFVFVAFAVCAVLVANVTTANESAFRAAVTAISGFSGCAAIYYGVFLVKKLRVESEHAVRMLTGEREEHTGTLEPVRGRIKIFNSITVQNIILHTAEGDELLRVNAEKAAMIPSDGGVFRVYTVHGYVTAFERADDENA